MLTRGAGCTARLRVVPNRDRLVYMLEVYRPSGSLARRVDGPWAYTHIRESQDAELRTIAAQALRAGAPPPARGA